MTTFDSSTPATLLPVPPLKAPFPWYGGKTLAAPLIWAALGPVENYVEPFAGSLAVLFNRPHPPKIETVNDKDCFIANIFRALQADPETVAQWCDWPVNEADQHAVHTWLLRQKDGFAERVMGDPDYYDPQIAGRWLWGICCWIGSGWCSGDGPWHSIDGKLVHLGDAGQGVRRKRVHLGDAGQGVRRKLVHLGDAGQGVHRKRVHLGNAGEGGRNEGLYAWFVALQARLRYVRVCCGDWTRVLGPSVTYTHGLTGILLDPPYSQEEGRDPSLYREDDLTVAHAVREWCLAHGGNPLLRIAFCGYGNSHDALLDQGWHKVAWTANGGYGNLRKAGDYTNRYREVLYFSPACLQSSDTRQLAFWES